MTYSLCKSEYLRVQSRRGHHDGNQSIIGRHQRRTLLGWAPAGILAAGLSLANTPRANAAEYSTYELQMNLACFTHLTWGGL